MEVQDVETELFEAIVNRRQTCLSAAAESASIPELESNTKEAESLLRMVEQYLLEPVRLTEIEFRRLYGQASYWIGFRANPSDKQLRLKEEALLTKLCSMASPELSAKLFEVVFPSGDQPFADERTAELKNLRGKCLAIIFPKAAKEAVGLFARDGGIRSLNEPNRFLAARNCLFLPDSPVWTTDLRNELFGLIRRGRETSVAYANARDFFHLIAQGLGQGMDGVGKQDIVAILSDGELAQCLWDVVTSRGIQYRMQIAFIRDRQLLIESGVSEALMPLTDDLRSRLRDIEKGHA